MNDIHGHAVIINALDYWVARMLLIRKVHSMHWHSGRVELSWKLKRACIHGALVMWILLILRLGEVLLGIIVRRIYYWSSRLFIKHHASPTVDNSRCIIVGVRHSLPKAESSEVVKTHPYSAYTRSTEILLWGDGHGYGLDCTWILLGDLHQLNINTPDSKCQKTDKSGSKWKHKEFFKWLVVFCFYFLSSLWKALIDDSIRFETYLIDSSIENCPLGLISDSDYLRWVIAVMIYRYLA